MPRKAKAKMELDSIETQAVVTAPIAPEPEIATPKKTTHTPGESVFNKPQGELVVDIFETNKEFVVLTAIAGVEIQDLDIAVEEDMMIISGQRANPDNSANKKYFYQECYWGPFSKKVILPQNINTKEADAQIDKGILTIKIPKRES